MSPSYKVPKIVYQDESFLVINKPAGLVVNRAQTVRGLTLQDWLEKKIRFSESTNDDFLKRSGLVHRLDKATSGLILAAKTAEAFTHLQGQFKKRQVKKKYLALVHGHIKPEEGTIDFPISRNPFKRQKFGVFLSGRKAQTKYRVLKYLVKEKGSKDKYSYLSLFPKSGRTHQLRVHLKHLYHPIVADSFYGGRKTYRVDKTWCPRLFLHASKLSFQHPDTGQKVKYNLPLPPELKQVLKKLVPA